MIAALVFASGEYSYSVRIVGGFIGQLVVLLLIPGSYYLHLDEDGNYNVIMILTAAAAIFTALIDSCAISLVAQYPEQVQESLQLGIGVSTLIGSVFRIGTKLYFPSNQVIEASLAYFYIGAATIFFCIIAFYHMMTLPVSIRCLQRNDQRTEDKFLPLSPLIASPTLGSYRRLRLQDDEQETSDVELTTTTTTTTTTTMTMTTTTPTSKRKEEHTPQHVLGETTMLLKAPSSKWDILRKVLFQELLVFLVFFQTLSLWPPLVTEIKSFNFDYLNESKWWSLILLFIFSLADVAGRYMVSYFRGPFTKSNIWILVLLRFVFFPLLICSVKGIIFQHDLFSIIFIFLFGWSNGYIGTLTIIYVNDCVATEEKGEAGNFTGFALNFGLVIGSTFALFVSSLVNTSS